MGIVTRRGVAAAIEADTAPIAHRKPLQSAQVSDKFVMEKPLVLPAILRPGLTNPMLWFPPRPPKSQWERIRKLVLERDDYTCLYCGHRAIKHMQVHHIVEPDGNHLDNLVTLCVACHAVMHFGRNLSLGTMEIWRSDVPQVDIVRTTRALVADGIPLPEVKKQFRLKRGIHAPSSVLYPNTLIEKMGSAPRAYLPEPHCAIFIEFVRWQIEGRVNISDALAS